MVLVQSVNNLTEIFLVKNLEAVDGLWGWPYTSRGTQNASLKCSVLDFINFMTVKLSPMFPDEML